MGSIIRQSDYNTLIENGKTLNRVLHAVVDNASSGTSTETLDSLAIMLIEEAGAIPACLNYKGHNGAIYKHSTCISVNKTAVHGVPSNEIILKDGDIVTVDCAIQRDGIFVDKAICFGVGELSEEAFRINECVKSALEFGIQEAVPGNKINNISKVIYETIRSFGFKTDKQYVGHGIGYYFHTSPNVPNIPGMPGCDTELIPGMCIAIEPIAMGGKPGSQVLFTRDDKWTVDNVGGLSSHCEDTVYISEEGPVIITRGE